MWHAKGRSASNVKNIKLWRQKLHTQTHRKKKNAARPIYRWSPWNAITEGRAADIEMHYWCTARQFRAKQSLFLWPMYSLLDMGGIALIAPPWLTAPNPKDHRLPGALRASALRAGGLEWKRPASEPAKDGLHAVLRGRPRRVQTGRRNYHLLVL